MQKIILFALAIAAYGQQVTISDTLTTSPGNMSWKGRVVVSLNSPGNSQPLYYSTTSLGGWQYTLCVGVTGSDCSATTSAGVITIPLYATSTITPTGTSYSARFSPQRGAGWLETWVVGASDTKLYQVRVASTPTPTTLFSPSLLSLTAGSILYGSSNGTATSLAAGTNGYVLTLSGGYPTWAASSGGGGGGTWGSITGTLSSQTDLQTALDGKISTGGLAGSATVLATARAINGVNFDGSAAITVTAAAGTLTGTTLASGVTDSSITRTSNRSFQIDSGDDGPMIYNSGAGMVIYDSTGMTLADFSAATITGNSLVGPLTGNASTATALQTARAINGVNFDGSAAITITANLPSNPTACSAGQYVSDIAADGTLTCGTPSPYTIGTGLQQVGSQISIDTSVVPTKAAANTFAELQTLQKGVNIASSTALATAGDLRYNGGTIQFRDGSGSQTLMNNPFTTRGDLVIQGASGPTRLAAGTSGYFLMANGAAADPSYQIPNASQVTNAFDKSTNNSIGAFYMDIGEIAAPAAPGANVARIYSKDDAGTTKVCYQDSAATETCIGAGGGSGTVTSVGWTGGIVSIANATTTPAFTIAGTSGGIPYFSSGTTWATSAALASTAVVVGGGAGVAPVTRSGVTIDSNNQLTSAVTAQSGVREAILRASVSDASGGEFILGNLTSADTAFAVGSIGIGSGSNRNSLGFRGLTTSANDTGTTPVVVFQAFRVSGDTLNGSLSSLVTRPAFSFTANGSGAASMQMEATGQLNIGETAYSGQVSGVDLGIFDTTATTGATRVIVQAGAGQSTTALTEWRANNATLGSGTLYLSVDSGGFLNTQFSTPSSSTETCTQGRIKWDADYIYLCTASNTYKRATLAAF